MKLLTFLGLSDSRYYLIRQYIYPTLNTGSDLNITYILTSIDRGHYDQQLNQILQNM